MTELKLSNNQLFQRANGEIIRYVCTAYHTEDRERELKILFRADEHGRHFLQATSPEELEQLLQGSYLRPEDYYDCFQSAVPPFVPMNGELTYFSMEHFKGGRYHLIALIDDPKLSVLYYSLTYQKFWVRPLDMFNDLNSEGQPRFTYKLGERNGQRVFITPATEL